ncbi:integrator complex subunit 7-like [Stylophora pistillata]|uniref:integrator complex subunit 7-like n=1 Tax=Stylophora pistillata TaxID=50429 RepID=UPI000C04F634|nr:integrator complex subunit 7-like [Stylophora pistillata]
MATLLSFGTSNIGQKTSNNSDSWQDANSALSELDKGLRSSKAGEQCEAIVRFPELFEKYPFPILINSAQLKLADVFRIGSNFLRLCILKVIQQSDKHLDKILNVDEFLKRIYSVIHSNDPVARAITVRVLGSIACIVSERKNVHHREFASGLYNKIAQLIGGLNTPVEMKLKLISIFRHMHYDLQLTAKVHELCSSLLSSHPMCRFVVVTLHTLSCLAVSSVIDIPKQTELLLKYLMQDPRKVVKNHTLSDLRMLAKGAPHMWRIQDIEALSEFILSSCYDNLTFSALRTMVTLSRSEAVDLLKSEKDKEDSGLCEQAAVALESGAVVCCVNNQLQALKVCLSSINRLMNSYPEVAPTLVESVSSLLPTSSGAIALELCHVMVTMATQIPSVLAPLRSEILSHFAKVVINADDDSKESKDLVVGMATLVLQSYQSVAHNEDETSVANLEKMLLENLGKLTTTSRYWTMFRVGKQATRLGFHSIAAKIFGNLSSKVASEHFYFWLTALKCFCEAESVLRVSCDSQLMLAKQIAEACAKYHKGITTLKVCLHVKMVFLSY